MRHKNTAFYQRNTKVLVDFSAEGISSDGAVVLLEKFERKYENATCYPVLRSKST